MRSSIYNDSISTVVVEKIKKFLFFFFVINDIILVLNILYFQTYHKYKLSVRGCQYLFKANVLYFIYFNK